MLELLKNNHTVERVYADIAKDGRVFGYIVFVCDDVVHGVALTVCVCVCSVRKLRDFLSCLTMQPSSSA